MNNTIKDGGVTPQHRFAWPAFMFYKKHLHRTHIHNISRTQETRNCEIWSKLDIIVNNPTPPKKKEEKK